MKRYIRSKSTINASSKECKLFSADFYRMLSDAIPIESITFCAPNRAEARMMAEYLAKCWGYNPNKIMLQNSYVPYAQYESTKKYYENNIEYTKRMY